MRLLVMLLLRLLLRSQKLSPGTSLFSQHQELLFHLPNEVIAGSTICICQLELFEQVPVLRDSVGE